MDDFLKTLEELNKPDEDLLTEEPKTTKSKKPAQIKKKEEPKHHVRIPRPMTKAVPVPRRGGKSIS